MKRKYFWKAAKCKLCKIKTEDLIPIEMSTAEGPHEIEVCEECAKFFDAMTDTLEKQYSDYGDEND